MREYTPEVIESLNNNEVFVFGSNATGFHGAGAAGFACRGVSKNNWREDQWFLDAMKSPIGSVLRIGNWAVYGIAHGFQSGKNGSSYAIETIKRPGQKRSTSLEEISLQIAELSDFAADHSELKFLVSKIGSSLAGYSIDEIRSVFVSQANLPDNIILPYEYEFRE